MPTQFDFERECAALTRRRNAYEARRKAWHYLPLSQQATESVSLATELRRYEADAADYKRRLLGWQTQQARQETIARQKAGTLADSRRLVDRIMQGVRRDEDEWQHRKAVQERARSQSMEAARRTTTELLAADLILKCRTSGHAATAGRIEHLLAERRFPELEREVLQACRCTGSSRAYAIARKTISVAHEHGRPVVAQAIFDALRRRASDAEVLTVTESACQEIFG
jgi:hypothetical protein